MPFGPTIGPATFINMIYDVDCQLKALATSVGITIGDATDMRIIVDDIVSHGPTIDISLLYMECQLRICCSYHLSLSLKKSFIFPLRFKFIDIDVSPDGNRPAQMKHQLLEFWPKPDRTGCRQIHWLRAILQHVHPSFRTLNCTAQGNHYQIGIHCPCCSGRCSALFGQHRGSKSLRPMPHALQPPPTYHPSNRLFCKGLWLRCLPTWHR